MKNYLFLILATIISVVACTPDSSESVVHRRNFSKNVFEEEFASVEIGCDTTNQIVLLRNTKWFDIDEVHQDPNDKELYILEKNKRLSATERKFEHDLFLERIQNGAFMFRYTAIQNNIDTVQAIDITNEKIELTASDSVRLFYVEAKTYFDIEIEDYKPVSPFLLSETDGFRSPEKKYQENIETIYRNDKIVDKGRVVCKCDYLK